MDYRDYRYALVTEVATQLGYVTTDNEVCIGDVQKQDHLIHNLAMCVKSQILAGSLL